MKRHIFAFSPHGKRISQDTRARLCGEGVHVFNVGRALSVKRFAVTLSRFSAYAGFAFLLQGSATGWQGVHDKPVLTRKNTLNIYAFHNTKQ